MEFPQVALYLNGAYQEPFDKLRARKRRKFMPPRASPFYGSCRKRHLGHIISTYKTIDAVKPVFRKWGYNVKEVQDESVL